MAIGGPRSGGPVQHDLAGTAGGAGNVNLRQRTAAGIRPDVQTSSPASSTWCRATSSAPTPRAAAPCPTAATGSSPGQSEHDRRDRRRRRQRHRLQRQRRRRPSSHTRYVLGQGDTISGNSIFGNAGLGIDLGDDGVTPNVPAGSPAGPTASSPTRRSPRRRRAAGTTISGDLDAAPSTTYTVEFFANPAADPSGYGQGQTFLGSVDVTTDATGHAAFTSPPRRLAGQFLTATATDPGQHLRVSTR